MFRKKTKKTKKKKNDQFLSQDFDTKLLVLKNDKFQGKFKVCCFKKHSTAFGTTSHWFFSIGRCGGHHGKRIRVHNINSRNQS